MRDAGETVGAARDVVPGAECLHRRSARKRHLILWGILAGIGLTLAACGALSRSATPEPRPTLPLATLPASVGPQEIADFHPIELASIEKGRVIYEKLCDECHGADGRGRGARSGQLGITPADFTDPNIRNQVPLSWYFRATTNGVVGTAMLSWASQLNEQQRWDVTLYTWSLASSDESIARGRELYAQQCASCHGPGGLGDGPRAGSLETPPTPLADPRWLAGRSGDELLQAMSGDVAGLEHDWSRELTEEERRAIIDYLWTFLYVP